MARSLNGQFDFAELISRIWEELKHQPRPILHGRGRWDSHRERLSFALLSGNERTPAMVARNTNRSITAGEFDRLTRGHKPQLQNLENRRENHKAKKG